MLGSVAHSNYIFGASDCWGWFDNAVAAQTTPAQLAHLKQQTVLLALPLLTDST